MLGQGLLVGLMALVLSYAVSRLVIRKVPLPATVVGLALAHLISVGVLVAMVVVIKAPFDGLSVNGLFWFVIGGAIWFGLDRAREHYPRRA